jgi:hypothetical protein
MWFGKSEKQREREHLERMKALEQGLPIPEIELAWYRIVKQRGEQLTGILIVGTVVLVGGSVGATALLLALGHHLPAVWLCLLLAVVWSATMSTLSFLLRHGFPGLMQMQRSMPPGTVRPGATPDTLVVGEADVRSGPPDTHFIDAASARREVARGVGTRLD